MNQFKSLRKSEGLNVTTNTWQEIWNSPCKAIFMGEVSSGA